MQSHIVVFFIEHGEPGFKMSEIVKRSFPQCIGKNGMEALHVSVLLGCVRVSEHMMEVILGKELAGLCGCELGPVITAHFNMYLSVEHVGRL